MWCTGTFWCVAWALIALYVCYLVFLLVTGDADLTVLRAKQSAAFLKQSFEDKTVWIIGASSGIGEYLAYELAQHGARVVLTSRRENELQRVASKCKGKHAAVVYALDALELDQHEAATKEVISKVGKLDIVVLNAGRAQRATALDTSLDVTKALFELNVLSLISLAKAVLPHFLANKKGQFVVTSSLAGKIAVPVSSSYSMSKFALHGYFEALRAEVSCDGVDVCMVCPGPVATPIVEQAFGSSLEQRPKSEDNMRKMTPERHSFLMAVSMANRLDQVWLSPHPALIMTYINQYLPTIGIKLSKIIGGKRVKALKEGKDPYDFKGMFFNKRKAA